MSDNINLRCPECGTIRKPIISPLIPDHIVVVCHECMDRSLRKRMTEGVELMAERELRRPFIADIPLIYW